MHVNMSGHCCSTLQSEGAVAHATLMQTAAEGDLLLLQACNHVPLGPHHHLQSPQSRFMLGVLLLRQLQTLPCRCICLVVVLMLDPAMFTPGALAVAAFTDLKAVIRCVAPGAARRLFV